GEIAEQQRVCILRRGTDLAEEETTPAAVLRGRNVALHHVDHLMIHQRIHALAGGIGLECVRQRGDVQNDPAMWRGEGGCRAVIGEGLHKDSGWLGRNSAEYTALPRQ